MLTCLHAIHHIPQAQERAQETLASINIQCNIKHVNLPTSNWRTAQPPLLNLTLRNLSRMGGRKGVERQEANKGR